MSQGYEVVRPKPQRSGQPLLAVLVVFLIIGGVFYFLNSGKQDSEVIVEPTSIDSTEQISVLLHNESLDQLDAEHEKRIDDLGNRHKEALDASLANALRLERDISDLRNEVRALKVQIDVKDKRRDIMAEQITALMSKIPSAVVANEKPIPQVKKAQAINKVPTEAESAFEVITTDYKLLSSSPPTYPRRAQNRSRAGSVIVKYTITKAGSVSNLEVIDERPDGWGFGRATLTAAAKLKYMPRTKDGSPVETHGVTKKYSFSLE